MKDDMYWCERDDLWLNPTAEVPVTNLHQDEILREGPVPIFYTAYLPSFRREAGRHAEMKGMIRVHEFNKVELVKFVHPKARSRNWRRCSTTPRTCCADWSCRTACCCCAPGTWASLPPRRTTSNHTPREPEAGWKCSSCSCFTDFQARRARIKYRPEPHLKSEFVHTLNGSGVALPRTMVSIMENNQDREGRIRIPKVLQALHAGTGTDRIGKVNGLWAVKGGLTSYPSWPALEPSWASSLPSSLPLSRPLRRLLPRLLPSLRIQGSQRGPLPGPLVPRRPLPARLPQEGRWPGLPGLESPPGREVFQATVELLDQIVQANHVYYLVLQYPLPIDKTSG